MPAELPPHVVSPFSYPISAEFPGFHGFLVHPAKTGVKGYGNPWLDITTGDPIFPPGSPHLDSDPKKYLDESRFLRKTKKDIPASPGVPAKEYKWTVLHRPGNWVYGNLDWMGKDKSSNPVAKPGKMRLSFWGPQSRYFPEDGFKYGYKSDDPAAEEEPKHSEIYYKGMYLAVAPKPVLGAAMQEAEFTNPVTKAVTKKKWLIAACLDDAFPTKLILYIREYPDPISSFDIEKPHHIDPVTGTIVTFRQQMKELFDEKLNPSGWHRSEIELYESGPLPTSEPDTRISMQEVFAQDSPWFFNESGNEVFAMLKVKLRVTNNRGAYPPPRAAALAPYLLPQYVYTDGIPVHDQISRLCFRLKLKLLGVKMYPELDMPAVSRNTKKMYVDHCFMTAWIGCSTGWAYFYQPGEAYAQAYQGAELSYCCHYDEEQPGGFSYSTEFQVNVNPEFAYILAADWRKDEPIFIEAARKLLLDLTIGFARTESATAPNIWQSDNSGAAIRRQLSHGHGMVDVLHTFIVKEDALRSLSSLDRESFFTLVNRLPLFENASTVGYHLDYLSPAEFDSVVTTDIPKSSYSAHVMSGAPAVPYDPKNPALLEFTKWRAFLGDAIYLHFIELLGPSEVKVNFLYVTLDGVNYYAYRNPSYTIPNIATWRIDNYSASTHYCGVQPTVALTRLNSTYGSDEFYPFVDHFDRRFLHYMDFRRENKEWAVYTKRIESWKWPTPTCKLAMVDGDAMESRKETLWQICDFDRRRDVADREKVHEEWTDPPQIYLGPTVQWGEEFYWVTDAKWARELPRCSRDPLADAHTKNISMLYSSFGGGYDPAFMDGNFHLDFGAIGGWGFDGGKTVSGGILGYNQGYYCPSPDMIARKKYTAYALPQQNWYLFWEEDGKIKTELRGVPEMFAHEDGVTPSGFGLDDYGNKIISMRYKKKNALGVDKYHWFNYLEDMGGKVKDLYATDMLGPGPEWCYPIGTV